MGGRHRCTFVTPQVLFNLVLMLSLMIAKATAADTVCVIGDVNNEPNGLKCTITEEADFAEIHSNVTALSLLFENIHNVDLRAGIIPSLPDLEYLQMDVTYFDTMPAGVFRNLASLTELSISQQFEKDFILEVDAFTSLNSLEKLTLGHLNLKSLDVGVFNGLSKLGQLHLNNNDLATLPKDLFIGLSSLHTLLLYHNSISDLKDVDFTGLSSIVNVDLTDNEITAVEAGSFAGLENLEKINLDNNGLTTIRQDAFAELGNVETMLLEGNLLNNLPKESFKGMGSLKLLEIQENDLSQVDEAFQGLASLEILKLTGNRFKRLTNQSFSGLSSLRELDLSQNRDPLEVITDNVFAGLTRLEQLKLDGNRLNAISTNGFKGLDALKTLDLSHNQLTTIPDAMASLGDDTAVNLVSNPWDCTDVSWLAQWYASRLLAGGSCEADAATDAFINPTETSCHTPADMTGDNMADLAMEQGSKICVEDKSQVDSDGGGLSGSEKAAIVACLILLAVIIVGLVALCIYCRQKKYSVWTPSKNDEGQQKVTRRDKLLYTARHKTPSFYWDPESGRLENIWDSKGAGKKGRDADSVDHAYSNPALVDNSPVARRRGDAMEADRTRSDYMNGVVVVEDGGIKHRDDKHDITYEGAALPEKSGRQQPGVSKRGSDNAGFYEELDPDEIQAAPLPTKSMKLEMRSSSSSGESDPSPQYPQVVVNGHHSGRELPQKPDAEDYPQKHEKEEQPELVNDHHYEELEDAKHYENPEYMQHKKTFKGSSQSLEKDQEPQPEQQPRDYIAQFRKFSSKGSEDGEASTDQEESDSERPPSDYNNENDINERNEVTTPDFVVTRVEDDKPPTPRDSPVPAVRVPTSPRVLIPESERAATEDVDNSRHSSRSSSSSALISDHEDSSPTPIADTPDYDISEPVTTANHLAVDEPRNRLSHASDRPSCHSISSEDSEQNRTEALQRHEEDDAVFQNQQ